MSNVASDLLASGFLPSSSPVEAVVRPPSPFSTILPGAQTPPETLYNTPSVSTPLRKPNQSAAADPNEICCENFFDLYPDGGRVENEAEDEFDGRRIKLEVMEAEGWNRDRWTARAIEEQVYEPAGLVGVKQEPLAGDEGGGSALNDQDRMDVDDGEDVVANSEASPDRKAAEEEAEGVSKNENDSKKPGKEAKSRKKKVDKRASTPLKKPLQKRRRSTMSEVLRLQRALGTAEWTDSREIMGLKEAVIVINDSDEDRDETKSKSKKANEKSGPPGKRRKNRDRDDDPDVNNEMPRRSPRAFAVSPRTPKTTPKGKKRTLIQSSLITPTRRNRRLKHSFPELFKIRPTKQGKSENSPTSKK